MIWMHSEFASSGSPPIPKMLGGLEFIGFLLWSHHAIIPLKLSGGKEIAQIRV